jgi:hypothetical protein
MSQILSISLLCLLSKSELTAFGKYLKSPFFSNKKHLPVLFDTLRNAGARVAEAPEVAYGRVFPGEPFDQHRWNKALSDLNACIRDFLAVRHFQAHPDFYRLAEVAALAASDNDVPFRRAARAVLDEAPGRSAPDRTEAWWLRLQVYKSVMTHPRTDRMKGVEAALDNMESHIDTYYYVYKLQIACNRLTAGRVLTWSDGTPEDFSRLLSEAERVALRSGSPLLRLYCRLTSLLTDSGAHFTDFYQALEQDGPALDNKELWTIVYVALNRYIALLHRNPSESFGRFTELFAFASRHRLFGGPLWEDAFLNFGVSFARLGDKVNFDHLMRMESGLLPTERRDDALVLISAYWHFYNQDYDKAQEQLVFMGTRHPRYVLMLHLLSVRNTYMLSVSDPEFDIDQVERALKGFGDFLKRQSVFSKAFCKPFADLIWFIRKMCALRMKRGVRKEDLVAELEKRQPAAVDWLRLLIGQLPN